MKRVKVYLDNCCFNRPYDDQNYLTIFMETYAKIAIQQLINTSKVDLVWSFILDYENSANPDRTIQKEIFRWRNKACSIIHKNTSLIVNAEKLLNIGLSNKDALHLASAIEAKVDFFLTVDKGILKKKDKILEVTISNPLDFLYEWEEQDEKNRHDD